MTEVLFLLRTEAEESNQLNVELSPIASAHRGARPWGDYCLAAAAALSSLLYGVLAIRCVTYLRSLAPNPSGRNLFFGFVLPTVVLYVIAVAMAISERHRSGALVPVVGAGLFGSLICLFSLAALGSFG